MTTNGMEGIYYILGAGRTGKAAARAIEAAGGKAFLYDDDEKRNAELKARGFTVEPYDSALRRDFSAVIMSPGIPLTHPICALAAALKLPVICDIELFAHNVASAPDTQIIAVTGTNGKSTVTALVTHVLNEAGLTAYAGGNIGKAVFELSTPKPGEKTVYILEISSYQADMMRDFLPDCGIFLNLTADHLDRHGDMEGYFAAKAKMFQNMSAAKGVIVTNDDDSFGRRLASEAEKRGVTVKRFGSGGEIDCNLADLKEILSENPFLAGDHNAANAAAVLLAAEFCGVSLPDIHAGLKNYRGLPHRTEFVAEFEGVTFINDSKATNAISAEKALTAFERVFWLAGGVPKSDGLTGLADDSLKNISKAFTFGQAKEAFFDSLSAKGVSVEQHPAMRDAFAAAVKTARQAGGGVILLSPACASFDEFKDYEARGDAFKALVKNLLTGQTPSAQDL